MAADDAPGVFEALSDPVRRRLLARVASAPATATELAGELPITRQAVSRHLGSLSSAGLLARERSGRDVRYRLTPQPLTEVVRWIADVGGAWDARLDRLAARLEEPEKEGPGAAPRTSEAPGSEAPASTAP